MNLLNWNNFASQVFMCSNDDQVVRCPHNLRLHMFVTDFCRCNATKMKLRKLSFTHHQIENCNWKRTFQWLAIQVWWKPRSVLRRLAFIDKGPAVLWHSFAQYFECYIFLFRELELDLTWPYSEIDFSQNNSQFERESAIGSLLLRAEWRSTEGCFSVFFWIVLNTKAVVVEAWGLNKCICRCELQTSSRPGSGWLMAKGQFCAGGKSYEQSRTNSKYVVLAGGSKLRAK